MKVLTRQFSSGRTVCSAIYYRAMATLAMKESLQKSMAQPDTKHPSSYFTIPSALGPNPYPASLSIPGTPIMNANKTSNVDQETRRNMSTTFYRRPLPSHLHSFTSETGKKLFKEAIGQGLAEIYFSLSGNYTHQGEPAFCGLGSLTMVLNALNVDPGRQWRGVWRWYSEEMLECCAPLEVVKEKGITFMEFACLAQCNGVDVIAKRGDQVSLEEFKHDLKRVCSSSDMHMVVSFSRKSLGQTGDGHFSPIGAFHAEKDQVLVLDTARFKYPSYFCDTSLLYEAMKPFDKETGLSRGYFLLSKASSSTTSTTCTHSALQTSSRLLGPLSHHSHTITTESKTWLLPQLALCTLRLKSNNETWKSVASILKYDVPEYIQHFLSQHASDTTSQSETIQKCIQALLARVTQHVDVVLYGLQSADLAGSDSHQQQLLQEKEKYIDILMSSIRQHPLYAHVEMACKDVLKQGDYSPDIQRMMLTVLLLALPKSLLLRIFSPHLASPPRQDVANQLYHLLHPHSTNSALTAVQKVVLHDQVDRITLQMEILIETLGRNAGVKDIQ